jgi:hypothetical protein
MLQNLSTRFYGWAKGWLVLILFVLDGFFAGFLMPLIGGMMQGGQGGIQPLDLMMFQTPDKLFAMIDQYGDSTRAFYRNVELTVDIVYPLIYLFFFGLAISWLFQRGFPPNSPMRKFNTVILGAWAADLLENLTIVTLLSIHPSKPAALGWLLFVFSSLKWLFFFATVILLLIGLVMAIKNGFKKQE